MAQMAAEAGCLPETIFYWLRRQRIPTRSRAEAQRNRVMRSCESCGASMAVKPADVARGHGRFCSRGCFHAYLRRLSVEENAQHVKARELLNTAVSTGRIQRPDACEGCGREASVNGHHHDYSKPYDVEWLCTTCHGTRHRKHR